MTAEGLGGWPGFRILCTRLQTLVAWVPDCRDEGPSPNDGAEMSSTGEMSASAARGGIRSFLRSAGRHSVEIALVFAALAIAATAVSAGNGAPITWVAGSAVVALALLAVVLAGTGSTRDQNRRLVAERSLLDRHSREIFVRIHGDGRPAWFSPSAERILGQQAGRTLESLRDLFHPQDLHRLDEAMRRLQQGDSEARARVRTRAGDLVPPWLDVVAYRVDDPGSPGRPDYLLSVLDVSTQAETERQLEQTGEHLRDIIDNMPVNVSYIDAGQRYVFINAHMAAVFGGDPEFAVGKTIRQVRGENLYARLQPQIEAALRGERVHFEVEIEVLGRPVLFDTSYIPRLAGNGEVLGFYVLAHDITELAAARRDLERLGARDVLTGLLTGEAFERTLGERLRGGEPAAANLVLLRVRLLGSDGAAADDARTKWLAERLRECAGPRDLVARLGSDEFALAVAGKDRRAGKVSAGKLLAVSTEFAGSDAALDLAIGVAPAKGADDPAALMQRAAAALAEAVAAGGNTFRVAGTDAGDGQRLH